MSISLWHKIALSRIPKIGPKRARTLVSYCGSIEAIFQEKKKNLKKIPTIGNILAETISSSTFKMEVDEEVRSLSDQKVNVYCFLDDLYPRRLKHFADSPITLFQKGNASLNPEKTIGIVGTRKPSEIGKINCQKLVASLNNLEVTTVSGLAYGVDIFAHKKSLEYNIPTIGVLGSGINKIYPSSHRSLAQKLLNKGSLISEYRMDAKADRENFPMRNRIIAALSDVVVVIESGIKGGSRITAQLANGYNKEVATFPGRVQDEKSAGCNALIKSNQAVLIENAADLISLMNWDVEVRPRQIQGRLFEELNNEEKGVYEVLSEVESMHIDEIAARTSFSTSKVPGILLSLEFKGLVKTMPGKQYLVVQ